MVDCADFQDRLAFGEADIDRKVPDVGNLALEEDTILVEDHHRAYQENPDPVGSPGARIADWAAEEVHKGYSKGETVNAEGTVAAVAGASGFGAAVDLALFVAERRNPETLCLARSRQLVVDEHSIGEDILASRSKSCKIL